MRARTHTNKAAMKQIKAHIKLTGGNLLSAANASRIIARATSPTDRYGNALTKGQSPIERLRGEPPYMQRWAVKKEPEGFIFREVTNNSGTCGHHPTVRALVQATLTRTFGIIVEVAE